jgi:hypothetical protein
MVFTTLVRDREDAENRIACLKPGFSPSSASMLFSTEYAGPAAFLFEANKLTAVLAFNGAEYEGIDRIITDEKNRFAVISYSTETHTRNYLLDPSSDIYRYLTDGEVGIIDVDRRLFRAKGKKRYWQASGAFWFDAVIDQRGNIVDIEGEPGANMICMSKAEFFKRAGVDWPLVKRGRVCVAQ